MIDRLETENLKSLLGYFPVLGIVGPRQVGKTTLSKSLASVLQKEVIYIDLENPADLSKLSDPVLFYESNKEKCLLLDEVQRAPEQFPILRSMVDQNRVPARFIVLGSASPELLRNSSESLAGRIAYVELTPFNLLEIVSVNPDYKIHWFRGGFPDAYLSPNDNILNSWHSNFVKTYIERDLPQLGLNINSVLLRKLWTMVAYTHGNVLNLSTLGRSLDLTSNTVKRYLSFLESAFLIRLLQPFAPNLKKRLVKSPKIYIRDSGILHYLLSIHSFSTLESNPALGNSWEGYVIEQILQRTTQSLEGYYYRTQQGAECDLVLTRSGKPVIGIEIKYSSAPKPTKGVFQAFEDLGTKENYIITPNTDDYLVRSDIRVCSLITFMQVYLPGIVGRG
ncbi:MAG: ATP-binding protein [Cyclobacteriaceae bacterium]